MKILITGSLGLTGSACVALFKKKGWEVIGVDSNLRAHFFGTQKQEYGETIHLDVRNFVDIEDLFEAHKFDAIIHTAAQPSHDYSTDHVLEDFDVNARATIILLEATRKYCPDATFIYVSTDKVYGENMNVMVKETETRYDGISLIGSSGFNEDLGLDFAGHRSLFGCSKLAGDLYAQEYAQEFKMNIGIFRPGCITGKNHQGAEQHGFLAYLARCVKEGKTYTIYGNGKQVRDQIHANDVASAFFSFIEKPQPGGVYNIGGGVQRSVSVLEAAEMVVKKTGKPFLPEFAKERAGDRKWDVHDISKFKADYPHFDYTYSLDDIINDICS